ncbi:DUF2971 domain-containing protein [Paenibacillus sp. EKM212P]|nr:DUF2971 domain-containing protein [Paenibacillus sp. EKM212P]
MENKKEDILYHYCGGEAFFNIIKNATLWLSDILKSNDSQECIWLRDLVKKRIETYLAETNPDYLKAWNTWYQVNSNIEASSMVIYATCFSESKDSLSQWRGYAQDGSGIAIGFSKKHLQAVNGLAKYNLTFNKVIYQNQEKFINRIFKENIKKMENKGIGHVGLELNDNYRLEFAKYKNPSFKEEKEWRIVLKSNVGAGKIRRDFNELEFSNTQYRYGDGKIISYLEMDFSKIKKDIIKEIWIGPKSKISSNDIKNMLSVFGYYGDTPYSENEPIPIIKSESSYR